MLDSDSLGLGPAFLATSGLCDRNKLLSLAETHF